MADRPENVVFFPGVTEIPAAPGPSGTAAPARELPRRVVLKTVLKADVRDLVVVGRLQDGELFVASQSDDQYHVTGLLAAATTWLGLPDADDEEYYDEPTG